MTLSSAESDAAAAARNSHYGEAAQSVSMVDAVNLFLRQWPIIVIVPIVLCTIVGVAILVKPRSFTATSALVVESAAASSRLSGFAAQLGVNVGSNDLSESPYFYAELITSREILKAAANARYSHVVNGAEVQRELPDILEVAEGSQQIRFEKTLHALKKLVVAQADRHTGLITLSVTTNSPGLSVQIASTLIDQLTQFDLMRRKTRAGAERQFVESRLAGERKSLREAEDELQTFLVRNRQFDSPVLTFTRERLERRVAERQLIVTSLTQAYESARIEEVRNIPAMTVIEPPAPPVFPDRRGLVTKTIVVGVLGLMLGIVLGFARDGFYNSLKNGGRGAEEYLTLRRRILARVPFVKRFRVPPDYAATNEPAPVLRDK